jgi:nicotinamide-nucleotide amidase
MLWSAAAMGAAVCRIAANDAFLYSRCMAAPTNADLARLARRVARRFLAAGERVATAESCTGGYLAKLLTDIAGSSDWFDSGVVCYSNAAKVWQLGVPRLVLTRHGAVSAETARAMVLGVLRRTRTDRAAAVTGIAGPTGGVPGKPVGTVWFAFARHTRGRPRVRTVHKRFRGSRDAVRRRSAAFVLRHLARP